MIDRATVFPSGAITGLHGSSEPGGYRSTGDFSTCRSYDCSCLLPCLLRGIWNDGERDCRSNRWPRSRSSRRSFDESCGSRLLLKRRDRKDITPRVIKTGAKFRFSMRLNGGGMWLFRARRNAWQKCFSIKRERLEVFESVGNFVLNTMCNCIHSMWNWQHFDSNTFEFSGLVGKNLQRAVDEGVNR